MIGTATRRPSRTGRRWILLVALTFAFLAALAVVSSPASAHSGIQSYVYVSVFDDALDGRVEYPINDLGPATGIDFPDGADDRLDVALANAEEIITYTDEHLDIGDGERSWRLTFDPEFTLLETERGDYLQVPFDVDEDFSVVPRSFVVTYSGIIEFDPERDALFLIENDWESATFGNEGEHLLGFSVGAETQLVEIDDASTFETISEIVRRGSVSIDRTLVVLTALITIVVGAVLGNRRDGPPPTWIDALGREARRVVWFTAPMVAVVGVLGVGSSSISERFAAGVGAVGVLLAAVSVVAPVRAAAATAAASGLASGVVIAQLFVFQQLDRSRPIVSFLAFTVGLVATTLFVAALVTPLLLMIRRWSRAGLVAEIIAAIAAVAGVVWLAERVSGVKFPLRTAELTVADLLTSPIVIAALTAVAVVVTFRSVATPGDGASPTSIDPDRDTERMNV